MSWYHHLTREYKSIFLSPTARSLALLRKEGYTAAVVEKYNAYTKRRNDLFCMFDILCFHPVEKIIVGVQTTTMSNVQARVHKLRENPLLGQWLLAGGHAVCHGWAKRGARGKRKLWECTVIPL